MGFFAWGERRKGTWQEVAFQEEDGEVFSTNKLVVGSVEITLEIQDGYSRGRYIEVCEEYIKDFNRELGEVTEVIKKEIVE